jgi:general secretion pathway protein G
MVFSLANAVVMYRMDHGTYPGNPEGLDVLVKPDASPKGPYLRSTTVPFDPWGNPYSLISSPCVGVMSLGADGKVGGIGEDADITSC